ncbi:MAG: hypothetical protein ACNI3A_11810 [Desulfovibrio sp.]|uniref:hypothetical protein n=1 Tax=Desulfovibrio sp. 7SRBS1 TaxID=3378064 RepID=UPI003B3EF8A5
MKTYGEVDALDNSGALALEGAGAKNTLKKFPSGAHGTQADARVLGGRWGERLHGIQEVVGSISSSSTNDYKGLEGFPSKPFFVGYTKEYTNGFGEAIRHYFERLYCLSR